MSRWVSLVATALVSGLILAVSLCAFPLRIAVASCLLGWIMLAIAATDARYYRIPDSLCLPAIPLGLLVSGELFAANAGDLVDPDNVIGAFAGGVSLWLLRMLYRRLRNREGLGLGDVKLAAAGGAWTGWQELPKVLLIGSLLALGVAFADAILRRSTMRGTTRVPFGSFLAPSIWIVWALDVYGRTA